MEKQNSLSICLEQPQHSDSESRANLIREWLLRFALNCGETLTPERASGLVSLWLEGFADLALPMLEAAFQKAIRACKFWPKIADIMEHVEQAQGNAVEEEAELKWQRVLEIRRVSWNPDISGAGLPKFSERVGRAVRASGIFNQSDMEPEALHVWAKKQFIESYLRYGEMQQEQPLLPDGELKNLLAGAAEIKALPSSAASFDELHANGLAYSQELKASGCTESDTQRAMRTIAREAVPRPPVRSLDEQKAILRSRGLLK